MINPKSMARRGMTYNNRHSRIDRTEADIVIHEERVPKNMFSRFNRDPFRVILQTREKKKKKLLTNPHILYTDCWSLLKFHDVPGSQLISIISRLFMFIRSLRTP